MIRGVLLAGLLLAVAGIGISGYLVSQHYADRTLVCGPVGDCEYVQESGYATLGGLPIAALGLLLYVAIAGAALAGLFPRWQVNGVTIFFSTSLAGALYSLYLTYIELFVLEAICVWCVASAADLSLLFLLSLATLTALGREASTAIGREGLAVSPPPKSQ